MQNRNHKSNSSGWEYIRKNDIEIAFEEYFLSATPQKDASQLPESDVVFKRKKEEDA